MSQAEGTWRPRAVFALDLRGLVALRIGMGLLLLIDLAVRATDYDAHYGDDGVIPREVLIERYLRAGRNCIHAWFGDTGQVIVWIVAAVAALMLTCGYRTRLATVVSWLLLASLHSRNFMVIQAGDTALRMMLFWAMFLPLGARWSIDAAKRHGAPPMPSIRTVATMALVAQIAIIYGAATLSKMSHPVWWREGLGVYYALGTEQFTTSLGLWLRDITWLVVALNYATLVVQAAVPVLLLSPWRNEQARTVAAAVLIPMHIGFMLCLSIGLFSYIMVVVWLVVLPSSVWDRAEAALARLPLPRWSPRAARTPHPVTRICSTPWACAFVGAATVYSLWWNMSPNPALAMSATAQLPGRVVRFDQRWHMFSNPPRESGWYVVAGELEGGGTIDPRTGEAPAFAQPALVSATFPGQRWRKYMTNIERADYSRHRDYFLDYLCRTWNRSHPENRLRRVGLFKVERATPPPGAAQRAPIRRRLDQRLCKDPS